MVEELQEQRNQLRQDAKRNIQKIQAENKRTYDRKRKKAPRYQKGDLVAKFREHNSDQVSHKYKSQADRLDDLESHEPERKLKFSPKKYHGAIALKIVKYALWHHHDGKEHTLVLPTSAALRMIATIPLLTLPSPWCY
ncbi:hypothetical protein TNCV_4921011 [Trichonephila clavipes]|uniref:Uncharacterized protein n=1 Tax=Trichonephila clavipes TaxID=2585209 RepID=A0A8X6V0Z1_TRICX|nr:hypothetical protein TNCV_4921011 [Trichonephila clavipes]